MTWSIKAFKNCADHPPIKKTGVKAWVNQFALVDSDDTDTVIYTPDTTTCAGVAALPLSGSGHAGVAHILSMSDYYVLGKKHVQNHTRTQWEKFHATLNSKKPYGIVLFGGQPLRNSAPLKDKKRVAEYFSKTRERGALYDEHGNTPALYEGLEPLNAYFMEATRSGLRGSLEYAVSSWIGKALHKAVRSTPNCAILENFQFKMAPHDCVIDPQSRTVLIGKKENEIVYKIDGPHIRTTHSLPRMV